MSYRVDSGKRPHKPHARRTVVDVATPVKLYAHNGTTADFAFPCWYQEVHKPVRAHLHDRHRHDHEGWPSPAHPDHSCQLWAPDLHECRIGRHHECSPHCDMYIDMDGISPIHLLDEGYTEAHVAWATKRKGDGDEWIVGEPPEGIDVEAWIDPDEDWVVRVFIDVDDPTALEDPSMYRLTVFVNKPAEDVESIRRPGVTTHIPARSDIVALSELVVLPSAYQEAYQG